MTRYGQYFSVWCHNSKCSDESVYTLNYPTYFYAWKRHIRKHYVSQFSIWPADRLKLGRSRTGRRQLRKSVLPVGSGNDGQGRNEEKSLGRGLTHCCREANRSQNKEVLKSNPGRTQ